MKDAVISNHFHAHNEGVILQLGFAESAQLRVLVER